MMSVLLAMIICFVSIGTTSKVDASSMKPSVLAHAYVVMDSKTGKVLFSQDADKKIYPASTTKLMTALVAIENCDLSKKITVKQSVISKTPSYATQAGLKVGYTYTMGELLNMLLVYSAADAADIIAVEVAGSIENFAKMMTDRAKSLGMNNTRFDNPIGLDGKDYPNNYSTASDMTKLTRYVMKNSTIRNIVCKPSYTINNYYNGTTKTLKNTNKFLRGEYYPKDRYKIIGTKTGYTDAAGYVLSTTARDKNGREVICAFFGKSSLSRMYQDIEKLLTYTYKNYGTVTGWCEYDNQWYYYDKSGNMKKGWLKYNNKWYYFNKNGDMKTSWLNYNNKWYYFNVDGDMKVGWLQYNNEWYYLTEDGYMKKGWLYYNNKWYYFNVDGNMVTNTIIDGWIIDNNGVASPQE